ncbi:GNAT family N-acetyltransferase [Dyadobacter aurulentus]|uniref:GNAT family N-acetyltransferase n=1 Tax=Dyadobacter sp. UC 10 TaxID=2605428 RepID=UPI0011F330C7|nr:GNAT family N-acetyltransferase [Dyadobacter sp. UC 10]KAA0992241.1 N-acetyltransferase [Dyadobacter sp. UC 10]
MENTKVILRDNGFGEILLFSDDIKVGEMAVSVRNEKLTVYHTEVYPEFEGRGFAKLLLDRLVSYAKENSLMILPLCPYVNAQFRRHPEQYREVWLRSDA